LKSSTLRKLNEILTLIIGSSLGVTVANLIRDKDVFYPVFFGIIFLLCMTGKLFIRHTLKIREQKNTSSTASSEPNDLNE
jgi:uncharacterized membrane protein YfcA